MQQEKEKPGLLSRYVPILHWLPRYDKAWLSGDIVAGLSVWALMVPQCLGFAAICGVPVQYGLYAAAIALIVYAFFASSHHVVTGPSSTIAAVTGAAVLSLAKAGSSEAIALVAAITMLAGFLYIILSVLRMGWVSNLSHKKRAADKTTPLDSKSFFFFLSILLFLFCRKEWIRPF